MPYFEWDEVKAEKNLRKYGASFEEAKAAFEDAFAFRTRIELWTENSDGKQSGGDAGGADEVADRTRP